MPSGHAPLPSLLDERDYIIRDRDHDYDDRVSSGEQRDDVDRDTGVSLPPHRLDFKSASNPKLDNDPSPQSAGLKGDTDVDMSPTSAFIKTLYK